MHPVASTRPAFALKQGLSRNLDGTERLAPPETNPGRSSETRRPKEIIDRSTSISHAMSPHPLARRAAPRQPDQRRWRHPVPPPRRDRSRVSRAVTPGDTHRSPRAPATGCRTPLIRQDEHPRRPHPATGRLDNAEWVEGEHGSASRRGPRARPGRATPAERRGEDMSASHVTPAPIWSAPAPTAAPTRTES